MKRGIPAVVSFLCISFIVSGFFKAGQTKDVKSKEGSEIHLSQKLGRILKAEMNAVQNGMTNLAIAIPAAHWTDITETTGSMNKGYLLNKKLTPEEMTEFQNSLPEGYRKIDLAFHDITAQMIEASEGRDMKRVNDLYVQLMETCTDCHARYAQKRFPGFGQD